MQIVTIVSVTTATLMLMLYSSESLADNSSESGRVFRDCEDCPEMVVIPPGEFVMGSAAVEPGHYEDESPQHQVAIAKPFAVGRFEVTVGEYRRFFKESGGTSGRSCLGEDANGDGEWDESTLLGWDNPGLTWIKGYKSKGTSKDGRKFEPEFGEYKQSERDPVICVSWNDAKAFAAWLSQKTGNRYRLLTEAEWEYAARAGTTTAYPWAGGFDQLCLQANGFDNSAHLPPGLDARAVADRPDCDDHLPFSAPVGSFPPNAFGLYDMIGNIAEWVEDCYRQGPLRAPSYEGVPADGSANELWCFPGLRVVRGGDWESGAAGLRSASRGAGSENHRYHYGFRLARDL